MRLPINIFMSLFLLAFISACGGGGGSSSSSSSSAIITASAETITIGNSTDLTAVFTSSAVGTIDNNIGTVTSDTPVSVNPTTTTTYTLTVTAGDGSVETSAITISVVALSSLDIIDESIDQIFQATQSDYTASVGFLAQSVQLKAIPVDADSSITANGAAFSTDNLSPLITLAEGADTVIDIVVTQNAVSKNYKLTVSRASAATFAEQAYLTASNSGAGDEFGYHVALSGDTLAVGAYLEDSSSGITPDEDAEDSGAVYIFTRSSSIWTQQAYLKASNIDDFDNFGISVALSGDTLAVGAKGEDSITQGVGTAPDDLDPDANSGAVYIFVRSGSSWSEQAYIKASNADDQDEFGISVALFGDTLAVGAHREDSGSIGINTLPDEAAGNSGAVYIFKRTDSSWTQQAYIKASNTGAFDLFGTSIALFGDTLAVGAHGEDSSTEGINTEPLDDKIFDNYGAVYVFVRNNTTWTQQAYIKASATDKQDLFGFSVALSGDTLAVGAHQEDSGTTGVNETPDEAIANSGAVYVFTRIGSSWDQQAYIKASNTGKTDIFGKSIALSGDVLVVGATQEDNNLTGINPISDEATRDFGAVYVYSRTGSSWSQQYYLKASTTVSDVEFGHSVALAGDTIAVGVPLDTSDAGAVYTFE